MWFRVVVVSACLVVAGACQGSGSFDEPTAPSSAVGALGDVRSDAPQSVARPWKASIQFRALKLEWAAGQPFTGVKGLFGGRCSVESDYVITMAFDGEATHAGRVTGGGSHCTQLIWTPQGPGGVTYSDGRGSLASANGSVLNVRWGHGTSGVDPATGEMWFKDEFSFDGGSGRFTGATGGGQEGGALTDFMAVLAGAPVPMWMEGTITYSPAAR